jgi:hypothetical protein
MIMKKSKSWEKVRMKRLLFVLCALVIGFTAPIINASVFVQVSGNVFEQIVKDILYFKDSNTTRLPIVERAHGGSTHYIVHKDGFYFVTQPSAEIKSLNNQMVIIVPAHSFHDGIHF